MTTSNSSSLAAWARDWSYSAPLKTRSRRSWVEHATSECRRRPARAMAAVTSRSKPPRAKITIAMPQVRGTVERFVSRVIPDVRRVVRTRPLEAPVIGAYVRGLSDRDIESLLDEAGLGHMSKNAASQVCRELRARYAAFCAKSLAEIE